MSEGQLQDDDHQYPPGVKESVRAWFSSLEKPAAPSTQTEPEDDASTSPLLAFMPKPKRARKPAAPVSPQKAYLTQVGNARWRGVEWAMTFEEWWSVWNASGQFQNRGRGPGQYVMARHRDEGPYAVGNVSIMLAAQNLSDSVKFRRARLGLPVNR